MSRKVHGSLPGLNMRQGSVSLLGLRGTGFEDGNVVEASYQVNGKTILTWRSLPPFTFASPNQQFLIALMKSENDVNDHHIIDPPGLSDISVTVTNPNSPTATTTIVGDIYDDDNMPIILNSTLVS